MSSSCANITATDPAVHCDCHNGGSCANPHLLCPETSSRCRPGDRLRSGYYHWTSSWLRATTGNDALTIRRGRCSMRHRPGHPGEPTLARGMQSTGPESALILNPNDTFSSIHGDHGPVRYL